MEWVIDQFGRTLARKFGEEVLLLELREGLRHLRKWAYGEAQRI